MRRNILVVFSVIVLLLVGLFFAIPRTLAWTDDLIGKPVQVITPEANAVISLNTQPDFWIEWSYYPDTLFYLVRVYMPADQSGNASYLEFRFVPDDSRGARRDNPRLNVATGLLVLNATHTIVIVPYGPTQKLIDTYHPNRYNPPPTHLPLDWYEALAPANEPHPFKVVP